MSLEDLRKVQFQAIFTSNKKIALIFAGKIGANFDGFWHFLVNLS